MKKPVIQSFSAPLRFAKIISRRDAKYVELSIHEEIWHSIILRSFALRENYFTQRRKDAKYTELSIHEETSHSIFLARLCVK